MRAYMSASDILSYHSKRSSSEGMGRRAKAMLLCAIFNLEIKNTFYPARIGDFVPQYPAAPIAGGLVYRTQKLH